MSKDIVPELWEEIEEAFKKKLEDSKIIKALQKKMEEGTLTAEDSFVYAKEIGDLRKSVLKEFITEDILPDGRMHYNIAQRILGDSVFEDYKLISSFSQEAFSQVNKNAGINLKGVSVPYNHEKTDGIINHASDAERYADVRDAVEEMVATNAKGYHDEAVRRNADFQYKTGLKPKIIRTIVGKTCKWCRALAGVYDYGSLEDNEVFRRHENCDCLVVYSPEKGKYQDVWSKKGYTREEYWEKNNVTSANRSSKLQTGGKDYARRQEVRDKKAEETYESIRNDNSDVIKIASNTGLNEEEIEKIKQHVFYEEHQLYDSIGRFQPDYDMAVAWKRLSEGNYFERDITLLKHESLEADVERRYNLDASEAHHIANNRFNWEQRLFDETDGKGEDDDLL